MAVASKDIVTRLQYPCSYMGKDLSPAERGALDAAISSGHRKKIIRMSTSATAHTPPASPPVSLDYFKQQCLDSKVGRYCFLSPADIEVITGRAEGTVLNDYRKGLIRAMNPGKKYPKFDYPEVHAYLVRVGWTEI